MRLFEPGALALLLLLSTSAGAAEPASDLVLLRTNYGDIVVRLSRAQAPQTSAQFAALADAGVYDGTRFSRLEKGFVLQLAVAQDRKVPLRPEQSALIHP